eukprot:scaffold22569_cov116-Cylindrotheca_fusiformis.AAC.6
MVAAAPSAIICTVDHDDTSLTDQTKSDSDFDMEKRERRRREKLVSIIVWSNQSNTRFALRFARRPSPPILSFHWLLRNVCPCHRHFKDPLSTSK